MTNVQLVDGNDKALTPSKSSTSLPDMSAETTVYVPFKKKGCIEIKFNPVDSIIQVKEKSLTGANKEACSAIASSPGVKALIEAKYQKRDANGNITFGDGIRVGGASAIDFGNTEATAGN